MQIRVLGCSGSIGGNARTTSFLVDDDVLVDVGTGTGDLTLEEMCAIDHIFLTHAHLDHIAHLPLLMDSVAHGRDKPIIVHARPETITALREHIFNWQIWPDFTVVPTPEQPFAILEEMTPGSTVELNGRRFRSIEAQHTVPAVGYLISGDNGSLIFSGDTTVNDGFWEVANSCADLSYVVIETSFVDAERDLSDVAKHLCPQLVTSELRKLKVDADVYITHLMPGQGDTIMREIGEHADGNGPAALERGHIFSL